MAFAHDLRRRKRQNFATLSASRFPSPDGRCGEMRVLARPPQALTQDHGENAA
jgi:hypothetical protein